MYDVYPCPDTRHNQKQPMLRTSSNGHLRLRDIFLYFHPKGIALVQKLAIDGNLLTQDDS